MNKDTIERLKEEMERGESSLEVVGRVCFIIKKDNPKLAERFAEEYGNYSEFEDSIDPQVLEEVYTALDKAEEWVNPIDQRRREQDDLMNGMTV